MNISWANLDAHSCQQSDYKNTGFKKKMFVENRDYFLQFRLQEMPGSIFLYENQ